MKALLSQFSTILDSHQKGRIILLFFMMLIGAAFEVVGVSLMLPLVSAIMQPDIVETNKTIAWICATLDLHSHRTFVIACILALVLVFIIKDLYLLWEYDVQKRFVFNNRLRMQKKLFHVYLRRPYDYFLSASSGEVLRSIQSDIGTTFSLMSTMLFLATEGIISFALIITIFIVSPVISGCFALIMGLVMIVISKIIKPKLNEAGRVYQKKSAKVNQWIVQAIQGIKEIKISGSERFFIDSYYADGKDMVNAEKLFSTMGHVPRLTIEMCSVCVTLLVIAVLVFVGYDINKLITVLGVFVMAAVKLLPSANRIMSAVSALSYQGPALKNLAEQLNGVGELDVAEFDREADGELEVSKEIKLSNITYSYPDSEKAVLQNADMIIPVGKSVGIVGTSGSGKTTSVDIMLGLLKPEKGQVLVDGVDISTNMGGWLSHVGYIPQMIFMLDASIRENVAFGMPTEQITDEKVWNALREAQLEEFVRELPDGLDTKIGERGVRLSGGQRQRIGIARALYNDPDVLVFDEATSALDNETEKAIMESINSLHGRKTLIIIAHRLTTIEKCDVVYKVLDGAIVVNE